jgi:ABC-2 type transport system permease protein
VPVLANGLLVSAFTFGAGILLLGFRPPLHSVPALVVVVLVTVTSCTAFGMLLGSIGLRAKDFFFAANLAYFLMLLFCGVNIPIDELPGWMGAISRCLPLTHGIEAARTVASGGGLGDVAGLVWTELGIGAAYALAAFGLFRFLERESRRTAVLDAY